MCFLLLFPGAIGVQVKSDVVDLDEGGKYSIINDDLFLMISSPVLHETLLKTEEHISLSGFVHLMKKIGKLEDDISELKLFKQEHISCFEINAEYHYDLNDVFDMVRSKRVNSALIKSYDKSYYIMVQRDHMSITCNVDFSKQQMASMLLNSGQRSANSLQFFPGHKNSPPPFNDGGLQCLRQGLFSTSYYSSDQLYTDYSVIINSIGFPAQERCSMVCHNRHQRYEFEKKHIGKVNFTDCQFFTVASFNDTCMLGSHEKDLSEVKIERYSWKSYKDAKGAFEASSFTGGPNCLPEDIRSDPRAIFNGVLVNVSDLCSFSREKFDMKSMKYQCGGLFLLLSHPINNLKLEMKNYLFHLRMKTGNYELRNIKRRSPIIGFGLIASKLVSIGKAVKPVVLGVLRSTATKNALMGLGRFVTDNMKRPTSYVSNRDRTFSNPAVNGDILNIETILEDYKQYVEISYQQLVTNYPLVISQLLLQKAKLFNSINSLLMTSQPLFNTTKDFLNGKDYLFTYQISNNVLVRQFVITQKKSVSNGSYTSLIPLESRLFYNESFWNVNSVSGDGLSKCLVALMSYTRSSGDEEVTRNCVKKNGRVLITHQVFRLDHFFGDGISYVLIFNKPGMIEVISDSSVILLQCHGFCVVKFSLQHTINLNGVQLIGATMSSLPGIKVNIPLVMVNRRQVMVEPLEQTIFLTVDNVQTVVLGLILLGITFALLVRWCGGRINISFTNRNNYNLLKKKSFSRRMSRRQTDYMETPVNDQKDGPVRHIATVL